MQTQAILVGGFGVVFAAALYLAYKYGSKAAQLDAARAQVRQQRKEQQYATEITSRVYALDGNSVRRRLHDVAGK